MLRPYMPFTYLYIPPTARSSTCWQLLALYPAAPAFGWFHAYALYHRLRTACLPATTTSMPCLYLLPRFAPHHTLARTCKRCMRRGRCSDCPACSRFPFTTNRRFPLCLATILPVPVPSFIACLPATPAMHFARVDGWVRVAVTATPRRAYTFPPPTQHYCLNATATCLPAFAAAPAPTVRTTCKHADLTMRARSLPAPACAPALPLPRLLYAMPGTTLFCAAWRCCRATARRHTLRCLAVHAPPSLRLTHLPAHAALPAHLSSPPHPRLLLTHTAALACHLALLPTTCPCHHHTYPCLFWFCYHHYAVTHNFSFCSSIAYLPCPLPPGTHAHLQDLVCIHCSWTLAPLPYLDIVPARFTLPHPCTCHAWSSTTLHHHLSLRLPPPLLLQIILMYVCMHVYWWCSYSVFSLPELPTALHPIPPPPPLPLLPVTYHLQTVLTHHRLPCWQHPMPLPAMLLPHLGWTRTVLNLPPACPTPITPRMIQWTACRLPGVLCLGTAVGSVGLPVPHTARRTGHTHCLCLPCSSSQPSTLPSRPCCLLLLCSATYAGCFLHAAPLLSNCAFHPTLP